MEVLPRLYGLTRLDVGCQPLLIFKGEVKSWQIESLELIGFGDYPRISLKDDFLESSELYFPSYVGVPGTPHPQGCLWVRERILENTEFDTTSRRIYITRRLTEKRRLLNEEEIVPILNKFGFEIVEAERLSFVEQVTLFRTAEAVVAPHGAGLANLMWVPAGCKVFELLDRDYVNDHFYNLSSILALDYHYQLCESENAVNGRPLVTGRDHMMVDVNKFKVTMELMLGQ
jgi:capsular polysaccharide biosynthesis protein